VLQHLLRDEAILGELLKLVHLTQPLTPPLYFADVPVSDDLLVSAAPALTPPLSDTPTASPWAAVAAALRRRVLDAVFAALVPLALSERNRALLLAPELRLVDALVTALLTPPGSEPLLSALVLLRALLGDATARTQLHAADAAASLLARLCALLAESSSLQLTSQLLALLEPLLRELRPESAACAAVLEHGMLPLTALLSNANVYIVVQTLLALQPLRALDELRAALRTFIDSDALAALRASPNDVVRQLAHELAHALAL